jgi:hypothetical protein
MRPFHENLRLRRSSRRPALKSCRLHLRVERLEDRALPSTSGLAGVQAQPLVSTLSSPGPTAGYSPAQVQSAYGFNQIGFLNGNYNNAGSGQTIAIVDAYNDPNIQSDLATFDAQYGLPAANLTIVSQTGSTTNLPATNAGWAQEISLDVEWAHAMAPAANIVLVEANSSSLTNLFSAVQYASTQTGASVVSMSWGSNEFSGESSYNSYFTTPGVTYVASAGDFGGVTSYPAVSPNVLGVGGTTLTLNSSGGYGSESAWSSGGGGSSTYQSRPSYQSNYLNGGGLNSLSSTVLNNGKLLSPDVSYDANPNTGFAVYDSLPYFHRSGWLEFGGTSAGAPQWSALIAIADQNRALNGQPALSTSGVLNALFNPATYSTNFNDVTTGKSGKNAAGPGYDLATGLGTPRANQIVLSLQNVSPSVATATASPGSSGSVAGPFSRPAVQTGAPSISSGVSLEAAPGLPAPGPEALLSGSLVSMLSAGTYQQPPAIFAAVAPGAVGQLVNPILVAADFTAPTPTNPADTSEGGTPGTQPKEDVPALDPGIVPGPLAGPANVEATWREALDGQFAEDALLASDPVDQDETLAPNPARAPWQQFNEAALAAAFALGLAGRPERIRAHETARRQRRDNR